MTRYSAEVAGSQVNDRRAVRFDATRHSVGITQFEDGEPVQRVLLTRKQIRELLKFLRQKPSQRQGTGEK